MQGDALVRQDAAALEHDLRHPQSPSLGLRLVLHLFVVGRKAPALGEANIGHFIAERDQQANPIASAFMLASN